MTGKAARKGFQLWNRWPGCGGRSGAAWHLPGAAEGRRVPARPRTTDPHNCRALCRAWLWLTPRQQEACVQAENDGVDVAGVLGAVNAELGGRWQVERRLAGGWNEGAYLLRGDDGPRAVLKWPGGRPGAAAWGA